MLKTQKVGITQRVDKLKPLAEYRDALDQNVVKWIINAGFTPVPIPNSLVNTNLTKKSQPKLDTWLNEINIDALLLTGGNDIGKVPNRDLTEHYLLKWAEKNVIPVLGICRGMQMMGVYENIKLIKVKGHVKSHHHIYLMNDNKKMPLIVNSFHNYALEKCPDKYTILAKSEDGVIEAIKHKKLPWEGWMWHPERDESFSVNDINMYKRLVKNG